MPTSMAMPAMAKVSIPKSRRAISSGVAAKIDGLVRRTTFDTVPPQVEYDLTEEGWSLVPVLTALYEWGQKRADRAGITLP
ncbi:winged helix-turn-helix transcriptional regulator [Nocardia sp. NPDC051990]|uniref:winged helix-turn-helix transcriptional regulator n=1 Tax=Nocardia sp. NPDC051990 TaxID=3155285 RepID=UPI00341CA647